MTSAKSKQVRVGRKLLAEAHKIVDRNLGEKVSDRAAIELCIEGMGDESMQRITDAVNARNRAYLAVNTLMALRTLAPEAVFDLRWGSNGEWWIVRQGEATGWPLGAIPRAEMDAAMEAAGMGVPKAQ